MSEAYLKLESVWNSKAFLHIEDRHELGARLGFYAGQLTGDKKGGRTASKMVSAFVEGRRLRPILYDLFRFGELPLKLYPEGRFQIFGGSLVQGALMSRVVTFSDQPDKRSPICIEIQNGPGKKNAIGGIMPDSSRPDDVSRVSVFIPRHDARMMAGNLLNIINQWPSSPTTETAMPAAESADDETFSAQPEDVETPEETVDHYTKLWAVAAESGFTADGFYRMLTEKGLTTDTPLSDHAAAQLHLIVSKTPYAARYNAILTPSDAANKPTKEMTAKFMSQIKQLADALGQDRDSMRKAIVNFMTHEQSDSYSSLCHKQVSCLINTLTIELGRVHAA